VHSLIQEIAVKRTWKIKEFPYWLVFEVEGQLQIRPQQYAVAIELIRNPGSILQLNMGEGKTRVILPMLILYWRSEAKYSNFIQRHHFLSQLIEEAFQYLHYHICASVFNVKLLKMPFNRDVLLSQDRANAMYNLLSYCLRVKGVLLVTPEQRLSLELKWYELTALIDTEDNSTIIDNVENIYNFDYIDMFDESDEQFRHKCQLIYSVGSCGDLPNGPNRWRSIQSVLRSLLVPKIHDALTASNAAVEVKPKFEHFEAFPSIQFLSGKDLESSQI
jgi:hypothetical protein